jgi:uncharacterized membrane protein
MRFHVVALLATTTLACGSADDVELGEPSGAECPAGSTLTYETFGRDFTTSYCTACHSSELVGAARHGAPSDHNFDTLDGLRAGHPTHVDAVAAAGPLHVNTVMPPKGEPAPSEHERRQLGEWIACGMP